MELSSPQPPFITAFIGTIGSPQPPFMTIFRLEYLLLYFLRMLLCFFCLEKEPKRENMFFLVFI